MISIINCAIWPKERTVQCQISSLGQWCAIWAYQKLCYSDNGSVYQYWIYIQYLTTTACTICYVQYVCVCVCTLLLKYLILLATTIFVLFVMGIQTMTSKLGYDDFICNIVYSLISYKVNTWLYCNSIMKQWFEFNIHTKKNRKDNYMKMLLLIIPN